MTNDLMSWIWITFLTVDSIYTSLHIWWFLFTDTHLALYSDFSDSIQQNSWCTNAPLTEFSLISAHEGIQSLAGRETIRIYDETNILRSFCGRWRSTQDHTNVREVRNRRHGLILYVRLINCHLQTSFIRSEAHSWLLGGRRFVPRGGRKTWSWVSVSDKTKKCQTKVGIVISCVLTRCFLLSNKHPRPSNVWGTIIGHIHFR